MYWWEKFSKINKRTGTTIPDSRVSENGLKYWELYVDGPICSPANNMCTAVD